jgi:hypothetical protein
VRGGAEASTGVVGAESAGVAGAEAERSRDCREALVRPDGPRELGGTSCTWRFSGWLVFAGGGRTKMNV